MDEAKVELSVDDPYEKRMGEVVSLVAAWELRHSVKVPPTALADLRRWVAEYAHECVDKDRTTRTVTRDKYAKAMQEMKK